MSANQKRKAEANKVKQENEKREAIAALERKRKDEAKMKSEKDKKERDDHVKMLENIFGGLQKQPVEEKPKVAANFEDIMKEDASTAKKRQNQQNVNNGLARKDPNVIHFDYLNPQAKLPNAGKASVAEVASVSFEETKKGKKAAKTLVEPTGPMSFERVFE